MGVILAFGSESMRILFGWFSIGMGVLILFLLLMIGIANSPK
jgi:hypothetical protein